MANPNLGRRIALSAIVAAGVLLLAVGVAHLPFVRAWVLDYARGYAARELGIALTAKSLHYNLLGPSAELRDLALTSIDDKDRRAFLQADGLRLTLGKSLFRGQVDLVRLELERPRLAIVRHADGTLNLPQGRGSASQQVTPLRLGRVDVRQLSLALDDEASGLALAMGPLDLSIDTSAPKAAPGVFGPGPFTIRLPAPNQGQPAASAQRTEPGVLSGTLAGRLAFDGTRLLVPELTIDAKEGRLALDGYVDVISPAPRVDVRARLRLDLAPAARLARLDYERVSGTLNGAATANGLLSAPAVKVALEGNGLALRSLDQITLAAESTIDNGRVKVSAIDLRSPLGTIHGEGDVALAAATGAASHLAVRWSDVDVDRAIGSLGYTLPVRFDSRASGNADLRAVGALGSTSLSQLDANASVALRPGGAGLALAGKVDLSARGGAWSLQHQLDSAPASVSLAGTFRGTLETGTKGSTIAGSSHLRAADLRALVPVLANAGVSLPEQIAGSLSGRLAADIDVGGTIERPTVRAKAAARDVHVEGLPAGAADTVFSATRDALHVQTLVAELGPTRLQASGSYAWSGRADIRFDARAGDLSALAHAFGVSTVPVEGSAQLAGRVWGSLPSPQAEATLDAANISIDGSDVGRIDSTLTLASNRLHVEAGVPAIALTAKADLDTLEPYRYQGAARFERTSIPALIPLRLRAQGPVSDGTFTGAIRAQGTLREPMPASADATLDQFDAVVNQVRVALEAPATVAWTPSRIAAAGLRLRVGENTRASVSGSLGDKPAGDPLRITAGGPLSELLVLAGPLLPAGVRLAADGALSADLGIGGTLRAPSPSGSITVRADTLAYGDLPPATDVVLDARVDPTQVVLQSLGAAWQQAKISANGSMPWRLLAQSLASTNDKEDASGWASQWLASLPEEPRSASLSARVTGVTPEVLEPLTSADLRDITGALALTLTADADALSFDRTRASVVLDEASVSLAGVPFKQTAPTRLRLENRRATIDELRWDSLGNPLVITGSADLGGDKPRVDVRLNGALDLRAIGAFTSGIATAGTARADLAIGGLLESPEITGEIQVVDGELRVDSPRLAASEMAGSIRIASDRTAIVDLNGTVNGGSARVAGRVNLTRFDDPRGEVTLTAEDVSLEYPDGFQTESNARLTLTLGSASPLLAGRVDVLAGTYREPLVLTSKLVEGLRRSGIATAAPASDFLSKLRLDLTVATTEGIRIDNNYGRIEIGGNLRIVGALERPGVIGRLEAAPDGEVFLAGNTYHVERLIVDFANPRAIAPDLSFLAQTRVGKGPVEVELLCSSEGPCERHVKSMTGDYTDAEAEERLFGVPTDAAAAGEQLARLLSGEVLGVVSRTVKLDTLRLEQGTRGRSDIFDDPTLVAGDVDPASRLTLGKRLGDSVELAYSQNLTDSGFTWSTTYYAPYGLSARALLLDDQSRSYEFRHEPSFGQSRTARAPRPPAPRVIDVRIAGTPGFPERDVRGRLRLTRGDRFQYAAWQRDRDRLEELYRSRGFYEARIRARRVPAAAAEGATPDGVVLEYTIDRGPQTRLEISGVALPEVLRTRILERWSNSLFDAFLERDARTLVRDYLYRDGYVRAAIVAAVRRDGDVKTLKVEVDPGPMVPRRLEFSGNVGVPAARLYEVAAAAGTVTAWIDPASFGRALEVFYRDEGFLTATVDVHQPEDSHGTSVVCVVVTEGPAFLVGDVTLKGGDALPERDLREALGAFTDMAYQPTAIAEGLDRIESRLHRAGYLAARTTVETSVRQQDGRVDVLVAVDAGPRSVLRDVIVEGANPKKPLVARAIALTPGAPIDPRALGATRQRLYDTGVYRAVEIGLQPTNATTSSSSGSTAADTTLVDARIQLLERPRYRLRYGFAYNDDVVATDVRDRRFGVAADLERRNLFGGGANVGVSARLRRDQQVGRVFLGASRFFGMPLRSTVFLERSRDEINEEATFPIVATVTDLSAEQAYSIRRRVEIRYGYAFGRNRTLIEDPAQDFDVTVRIARLTSSLLVDRRSDPFDPARGWFASSSLELSRPSLGSDLSFLKGFVQYFHFLPTRRGMMLASAVRVGLARTFEGQDLIPSERFFAGGATSVRGYREEDLGPRSSLDDAAGGQALLVINEELRFPIYRWVRGVGFVDLGNVYPTVGEISLGDLQIGVGMGVRLDTPIGLFRVDFGVPANPRSFDPKWRVHFGLGHSF